MVDMKKKKQIMACLVVAIVILCSLTHVRSDGSNHRYKEGDDVPLYANKVGPFHNPRYFVVVPTTHFCFPFNLTIHNWIQSSFPFYVFSIKTLGFGFMIEFPNLFFIRIWISLAANDV